MSLREAILEIAEEMIREADDLKPVNEMMWMTLRNYAKQLKVVVKAAEGEMTRITYPTDLRPANDSPVYLHPDAQHFQMIEQARKELRDQKRKSEAQEGGEVRMVVCEGGPADGDTVSVSSEMPAGARTMIDGKVYVLSAGGVLVWEEK